MLFSIGQNLIIFSFVIAVWSILSSVLGDLMDNNKLIKSGERAGYALFGLITVISGILVYALMAHKFQVKYVWKYTSAHLKPFYTATSFWAGQSGSLLFWAWLLSLFTAIVIFRNRNKNRDIMPWVTGVCSFVNAFFLMVLAFYTKPLATYSQVPMEGNGLNPLLQNLGMIFHPPLLFIGFAGFTIPFAFVVGAIVKGKTDHRWIVTTRGWSIFSWLFLGLGIVIGMAWAYVELGWGGYWAWDPVENASYMPWIIATAYLHSIMLQEKRGMMKKWNAFLVVLTFALCIYGTFITRSGIISSVHSFGPSKIGPLFFWFLAVVLVIPTVVIFTRFSVLKSKRGVENFLSKEGSFLLNNIFLLGYCGAVFLGTSWPIVAELFMGQKVEVGPTFYNIVTTPIALALLLLLGLCPMISWREISWDNFRQSLLFPILSGAVVFIACLFLGITRIYILLSFTFLSFTSVAIINEFINGIELYSRSGDVGVFGAFWKMLRKNGRRYGGLVVHFGIVLIILGITVSGGFKQKVEKEVAVGESLNIGAFRIVYKGLEEKQINPEKDIVEARLEVYRNGKKKGELYPEMEFFTTWEEPSRDVSIRTNPAYDLYAALAGWTENGAKATLSVRLNPMVQWIWIGMVIFVLGTIIAVLPRSERN